MVKARALGIALLSIGGLPSLANAQGLVSFPEAVVDVVSVSDPDVTLGTPDHVFTTGFADGGSATYRFAAPVEDITGPDLLIWISVNAMATQPTQVTVEGRATPNDAFVPLTTFSTDAILPDDQHDRIADGGRGPYTDFDHVHAFPVFLDGVAPWISELRIRNLGPFPLGLDAVEAIHPGLSSPNHAVEVRVFRRRDDFSKRFALRFKNVANLNTGVAMSGFRIEHTSGSYIDQTDLALKGRSGQFDATPETTAGPDNGPTTFFTEYVYSTPEGLLPGDVASHEGWNTIDTDVPGDEFFENLIVTVRWTDGASIAVDWLALSTVGVSGAIYSLYQFPPAEISLAGPRPTWTVDAMDGPPRPLDPIAPTTPLNLVAQPGTDFVDLSWSPSTDNAGVREYEVERSLDGFGFQQVALVPAGTVTARDTGLSPGALYFYRVRAVDVNDVTSDYSVIVTARTMGPLDLTPPTAPGNLVATAVSEAGIDLAWDPATDDVAVVDYLVQQALPGEAFVTVAAVTAASTSYAARGLPAETAVRFRVQARDAALNAGAPSNEATATTFVSTTPDAGVVDVDAGSDGDGGAARTPTLDSGLDCRAVDVPDGAPGGLSLGLWLGLVGWLGRRARSARRPGRAQRQ